MINKYPFEKHFDQNVGKIITIPSKDISRITTWVNEIVKVKSFERGYKKDGNSMGKRYTTGMLGEIALEYLLDTKFIDWDMSDNI